MLLMGGVGHLSFYWSFARLLRFFILSFYEFCVSVCMFIVFFLLILIWFLFVCLPVWMGGEVGKIWEEIMGNHYQNILHKNYFQ